MSVSVRDSSRLVGGALEWIRSTLAESDSPLIAVLCSVRLWRVRRVIVVSALVSLLQRSADATAPLCNRGIPPRRLRPAPGKSDLEPGVSIVRPVSCATLASAQNRVLNEYAEIRRSEGGKHGKKTRRQGRACVTA